MAIAFCLFESFKEDVCADVVPGTAYTTRVRRTIIDVAAKIVRTGEKIMLKVTTATWAAIQWKVLWQRCQSPPRLA